MQWNLLLIVSCTGVLVGPICAAETESILDKKVAHFEALKGTEVTDFCRSVDVPCGLVVVDTDTLYGIPEDRKTTVVLNNATIRAIADQVVKAKPQYQWKERNGVIDFVPKGRPDIETVLSTALDHFDVKNRELPYAGGEVGFQTKLWRADRRPHYYGGIRQKGTPPIRIEYRRISLHLKKTTVQAVLDALVGKSRRAMWILTPTPKDLTGYSYGLDVIDWTKDCAPGAICDSGATLPDP